MQKPFNRLEKPFRAISSRFVLVFMIALALALLFLGRAENYLFFQTRQVLTDVTAPLLEVASRPVAAVKSLVRRTGQFFSVFEDNERLRTENETLLQWKRDAEKLRSRLNRYEALLNVQVDPETGYVTGRVIGDTGGPFVETFILNVGRKNGVESGQAVIDSEGLIGRIVSAGEIASRVLLLTDLNSRIPVVIEPTRHRAILSGDNSPWPKLDYLPAGSGVAAGDRIVTSGHGGLMPPGLPVGLVIVTEDGTFRAQTFSRRERLDLVRVLQYTFPSGIPRQDPPPGLRRRDEGVAGNDEQAPVLPLASDRGL